MHISKRARAFSRNVLAAAMAATLVLTMAPSAKTAFAATDSWGGGSSSALLGDDASESASQGPQGAASEAAVDEKAIKSDNGSRIGGNEAAGESVDANSEALGSDENASAEGAGSSGEAIEDDLTGPGADAGFINQDVALATVAQAESTRTYFLAQTLEETRTVPMVSAKLPVAGGATEEVIGSFIYRGITYAVEPGGESVAVIAADRTRLSQDFLDAQAIVLPSAVSPDDIDLYSVTRIAEGAFSGLASGIDAAARSDGAVDAPSAATADGRMRSESRGDGDADEPDAANEDPDESGSVDLIDSGSEISSQPDIDVSGDPGFDALGDTEEGEGSFGAPSSSEPEETDGITDQVEGVEVDAPIITAITVPASVTAIESGAFAGLDTLRYVIVSSDNPEYSMYDGCLYDKPLNNLLLIPEGRLGAVRVAPSAVGISEDAVTHCTALTALIADPASAAHQLLEGSDLHNANGEIIEANAPDSIEEPVSLQAEYSGSLHIQLGDSMDLIAMFGGESVIGATAYPVSSDALSVSDADKTVIAVRSGEAAVAVVALEGSEVLRCEVLTVTIDGGAPSSSANSDPSPSVESVDEVERVSSIAEMPESGSYGLEVVNGALTINFLKMGRYFFSGSTDAKVTWTAGTIDAPAVGSIVNVSVSRYHPTGGESTLDQIIGASVSDWGADETQELIGIRNTSTGSYMSLQTIFSGDAFSFSFVMPPAGQGCELSSAGITYISSTYDTGFEPVYQSRENSIYSFFNLNGDSVFWENPTTGVRGQGVYNTATFSDIGNDIITPGHSIPVRPGFLFQGWYTAPTGGSIVTGSASAGDNGKTYYAHWVESKRSISYDNNGSLTLATGTSGRYIFSDTERFGGVVSWSSDTDAPTPGSVVVVQVTQYRPNGGEGTKDMLVNASFEWGGSRNKELIGIVETSTGSYIDIDSIYSGEKFSFSFIVPATSTVWVAQQGFSWVGDPAGTTFKPVFKERENSIYVKYATNGGSWKNPMTGALSGGTWDATVYSDLGRTLLAPAGSIPVRDGYLFTGWYTDAVGGEVIGEIASEEDNGRTYYAHWAKANHILEITGQIYFAAGDSPRCFMSDDARFRGVASWENGTDAQPAAGTVVTIEVIQYRPSGGETTRDQLVNASFDWGASETREFIGIRNTDTGAFIALDTFYSGEAFTLSFMMPSGGINLSASSAVWTNTTFEPIFQERTAAIYNTYRLNGSGAYWQNPATGQTGGGEWGATTYSTIGEPIITPSDSIPLREGYLFTGWFTEPDGGHIISGEALERDNGKTYYAHWGNKDSKYYFLRLHGNGAASTSTVNWSVASGRQFSLAANTFAMPHHSIVAWTGGADGSGARYEVERLYNAFADDTTTDLYAQWAMDVYGMEYDLAGGSRVEGGVYPDSFRSDSSAFTVSAPVRAGYVFRGWTGTGLLEPTLELSLDPSTIDDKLGVHEIGTALYSRSYAATWEPVSYKMSFDLAFDDGSASWKDGEAPATGAYDAIVYDAPVTFPKAPVRAGWIFTSWVRTDEAGAASYGAEQTVDPANFESTQDAIASFEAHWVRNLKATVPVGAGTAELSLTADWDADEFAVEEGTSSLVNLSDGALEVVSIEEDRSDEAALEARKANAREAFSARTSDPSALDAMLQGVSLLVQPVEDGVKRGEIASFPLFGGYALAKGDWVLPASTDPVNGTAGSTLELAFGMDVDRSLISTLDLKIGLQHKTVSSLVYTVALVDKTEPTYSVGA